MHGPLALLHVTAASLALPSGLFIVLWRKGGPLHRLIGIFYVFAMLMTNISALMIYRLTGHFGMFHAFALLSLICTLAGMTMPLLKPRDWLGLHVRWMGWSYLGLLAAALNESVVRLPFLHVNTPEKIFTAGGIIAIGIVVAGQALQPRLKRAVLSFTN